MYYQEYYDNVKQDIVELRQEYPFLQFHIFPTASPLPITIDVIAANKKIIYQTCAVRNDFVGKYTKKLKIVVPFDYKEKGCTVFGGSWIDMKQIPEKDQHIYLPLTQDGYKLCVGVPQSFSEMNNVILENVKTAECMLIAYERFLRGWDNKINLIAYSHGEKGKKEYARNKQRYSSGKS